jgi:hypothetical protein
MIYSRFSDVQSHIGVRAEPVNGGALRADPLARPGMTKPYPSGENESARAIAQASR